MWLPFCDSMSGFTGLDEDLCQRKSLRGGVVLAIEEILIYV